LARSVGITVILREAYGGFYPVVPLANGTSE